MNSPDVPTGHLIAKAQALGGALSDGNCSIEQDIDPLDWSRELPPGLASVVSQSNSSKEYWRIQSISVTMLDAAFNSGGYSQSDAQAFANAYAQNMQKEINGLEAGLFGANCANVVHEVDATPQYSPSKRFIYRVNFIVNAACLEDQIATVILAPSVHRYGNPGTSGGFCLFDQKFKAPDGDWDLSVMSWTRLAFLLRQVKHAIGLSAHGQDALDKLQYRLLTLSGGPAKESYNLVLDCGNDDNSYGTAEDRLNDNSSYDSDLGRNVQGSHDNECDADFLCSASDFLKKLFRILTFLTVLGLAALAAFWLGVLIAAALSSLLAAGIVAAVLAILIALGVPQDVIALLFGGFGETENHLLMENTSKFLKNKMMIDELRDAGDSDKIKDVQDDNDELRDWLMEHLRNITKNDFAEYNAKPYTRYSIGAILNLHDFTCDAGYSALDLGAAWPQRCSDDDKILVDAAGAVLDLTVAKAGLGSIQGLRFIPFRRRSETNTYYLQGQLPGKNDCSGSAVRRPPSHILAPALVPGERAPGCETNDTAPGGDYMIGALQFWNGQTMQSLDSHVSTQLIEDMIGPATSRYQPDRTILDLGIGKLAYQQTYHHAGWERYSRGPAWLVTAGGTSTGPAQSLQWPFGNLWNPIVKLFVKETDLGAGVPTTLMVASRRLDANVRRILIPDSMKGVRADLLSQLIRFDGHVHHWPVDDKDEPMTFDTNFCVHGSFACGINMYVPPDLLQPGSSCAMTMSNKDKPYLEFSIVDSATCPQWDNGDATDNFFAIVYSQSCGDSTDNCPAGNRWGFIEIVDKSNWLAGGSALATKILADNSDNFYAMWRSGGNGEAHYKSVINGNITFKPAGSYVTEVNNNSTDGDDPDWPRAQGLVNATGDYTFVITDPRLGKQYRVDFDDKEKPHRGPL